MYQNDKIISFDPGLRNLGWAAFELSNNNIEYIDSGVLLQKKKKMVDGQRLDKVFRFINGLIVKYSPKYIGHELMFIHGRSRSGASTIKLIGLIEILCWRWDIENFSVAPPTLKKFITGSGRASKEDMLEKTIECLRECHKPFWSDELDRLQTSPHHEIDACAIGLWTFNQILETRMML